jgi:serine protease Do
MNKQEFQRKPSGLIQARVSRERGFRLGIGFFVMLLLWAWGWGTAGAKEGPGSFADLAEKLLPAVVNVATTQAVKNDHPGPEIPRFPPGSPFEEFFRDFFDHRPDLQQRRATSLGSGFIIDAGGYVVTNNHVIADADEITVVLQNDVTLKAKIVGRDEKTDLALLKVEFDGDLPFVNWGDSDKTRVGDWVLAIGNPFGLGGSVTAGIVSARARDIHTGPYDEFIQTDASINRGNSGGPMFDLNGKVVGINTAIFSPSGGNVGIGFAIPASLARPVIDQLRKYGRTRRGWLGVRIQKMTPEIAESLGLKKVAGALVASTTEGGPAAAADIRPGDVILKFDGKDIPEMRKLPRVVAETPVETTTHVVVWRKGKKLKLKVTLGELEKFERVVEKGKVTPTKTTKQEQFNEFGLSLSKITPELREKYGITEVDHGVVVIKVAKGGLGSQKDLRPGDVIVEVAQHEVRTPKEMIARVKNARDRGQSSLLLRFKRRGEGYYVALPIE